jgi:hypothetical protein
MTTSASAPLDMIVASFKEGAARLADHLREQAALKADLKRSADDAEVAGFLEFAAMFHEMATKLGAPNPSNGSESPAPRRRGRPAKPAAEQTPLD